MDKMFAHPQRSRIVLINPTRSEPSDESTGLNERRRAGLALLPDVLAYFGLPAYAVGELDPSRITNRAGGTANVLDADVISLWQTAELASLAAEEGSSVFLGGAWLEEEVLVASLEGVRLGYDVRLLTDLSATRVEADGAQALDRLALHGVVPTTLRQAMLEWTVCLDDEVLRQNIQRLLS
jgi:hypothetical protein